MCSGGFNGWKSETAFGKEDLGLELFTGRESPAETLVVAYSLEQGLGDFYQSMIPKVKNDEVKNLFQKLAEIEIKHKDRIFAEYLKMSGDSATREEFEKQTVEQAVEGGLTTQEYTNHFKPDWESAKDIIELAMSIEAQALDLYLRVADRIDDPQSKKALVQISTEEQMHLKQLGKLMERVLV